MVGARGHLPVAPEVAYAFLADLDNHWRLIDRWARIAGVSADGLGATVRLHGPLGVRRTARTRVLASRPPHELVGEARVGRRTVGRVRWSLRPDGDGTLVELDATVPEAGALDRALLALGGRAWLRRRFAAALRALAAQVTEPTAPPVTMSAWPPRSSPAPTRSRTSPQPPCTRPAPRGSASP
jgi:Polyketide cyclase / dehydrase and lipid transport